MKSIRKDANATVIIRPGGEVAPRIPAPAGASPSALINRIKYHESVANETAREIMA